MIEVSMKHGHSVVLEDAVSSIYRNGSFLCIGLVSPAPASHCRTPVAGKQTSEARSGLTSPIKPVIELNLTDCQVIGFPVLMAVDLNAKHRDEKRSLYTSRVRSCLITRAQTATCYI